MKQKRREGVNEAEANATVRDKNNSLGLVICSYFDLSCHVCFFAFQVRLFHLQTHVVPPQEISKTEDLLYLKTTSITSHSSHTHTHIIHARRTVVVDLLLLFFFCYYIYLKKKW